MTTEESNKLIAEFMGWEKVSKNYRTPFTQSYLTVMNGIGETTIFGPTELRFHKSWDWLMPVVEKIEQLQNELHVVELETLFSSQYFASLPTSYVEGCGNTRKEALYNLVINYIKWYNNEQKLQKNQYIKTKV
jgi:hypothetical protein